MRKHVVVFSWLGVFLPSALFLACSDGEEKGAGGSGGGAGDGGGCPSLTFVTPKDGAQLGKAQDADSDCGNGIQVGVTVATNAAAGRAATLLDGAQKVGSAKVADGELKFSGITLQSKGSSQLSVQFDDAPTCQATISVTETCGGVDCAISKPVISVTHPKLNGVPAAQGGDRSSAPGQDYQAAFEVTTSIENGQPVSLTVDGKPAVAVALVTGGIATFPGVTLTPDGDHTVQALCTPKTDDPGSSGQTTYTVDTLPPDLTNVTPVDDQFLGPGDDANASKPGLQFKVCGQTSASDAADLPAALGAGANNFCVGIGTATPTCVPATGTGAPGNAKGGCVELDCPGGAPFNIEVSLKDAAGNPTASTVKAVRCASTLPSVQIVEPVSGTGADVSTHILAASASQTRKDQNSTAKGAQYTVVACSDVTSGTARLYAQLTGSTKTLAGTATLVPAQVSDNCPAGLANVAKFVNATLPESAQTPDNKLSTATELVVEVEDVSTAKNSSPAVLTWVDSEAPTIAELAPNPLCGKLYQSTGSVTDNVSLSATNVPVNVVVTSNGTPTSYVGATSINGIVQIGAIVFSQGSNAVVATTTEPSGNTGALKSPCMVTVGNPPVVTWTSPTTSTQLSASTDGDASAAGWQGTLSVSTDVGGTGATVTFKATCGATVVTIGAANVDGAGFATLSAATIPECPMATITAETSNVAGKGIGTASLIKPVDTVVPGAPTGLATSVLDRRATSFTLTWTAPGDGAATVGGYQVRVSKAPITAGNFDSAEKIAFSGSPKAPGQVESLAVNSRVIETNYYFAVAATDAAGNRSSVISAGPAKATFNATVLNGTGLERLGTAVDGSSDLNGDGFSDLVAGGFASTNVYIWFGSASGYPASPDVTITGPGSVRFGQFLAVVGDVDSDGLPDIAVGAPLEAGKGRVYLFRGRATWPASIASSSADSVINVDTAQDAKFGGSFFGGAIRKLGDVDKDGADDFAVGAYLYGTTGARQGYLAVIRGVASGQTFPAAVTLPQDVGTRAVALVGDPTLGNAWFGFDVAGLPGYYSGGNAALVVSAAGVGTLYGFQGGTALTGTVQATAAKESQGGSGAGQTGYTMANLGPIGAVASLGAGTPFTAGTGGYAKILLGTAAGVFSGATSTVTNSAATAVGDAFAFTLFGGGFSGAASSVSFIGAAGVDVVLSSRNIAGGPANLYIVEGQKLASGGGDIVTLADVTYSMPSDWRGSSAGSGPIKDLNKDGYGDIAIGEQRAGQTYPGRVVVLW